MHLLNVAMSSGPLKVLSETKHFGQSRHVPSCKDKRQRRLPTIAHTPLGWKKLIELLPLARLRAHAIVAFGL